MIQKIDGVNLPCSAVYLCAPFLEIVCQDVILTAIKDEGAAFEYASEELKNDYHFALEVVSMGGPGQEKVGDVSSSDVMIPQRTKVVQSEQCVVHKHFQGH